MSMHLVMLRDVKVDLHGSPTIKIKLPPDFRTTFASTRKERQEMEKEVKKSLPWVRQQIKGILKTGKGTLADKNHPMRSFGAGVLARIPANVVGAAGDRVLALNIRASNRGSVWPMGARMADALCWKEFAGVTSSAAELLNPRPTAIKELYEEIAFSVDDDILLPNDLAKYPDSQKQLSVDIARARRHYGFNLAGRSGAYPAASLVGDPATTVAINGRRPFRAVVNFDADRNALEFSFVVDIKIAEPLTGIMSLAGPEHTTNLSLPPYMEDVLLVNESDLIAAEATSGRKPVSVQHLLSVHGPSNLESPRIELPFNPAATLIPLIWYLGGNYSFKRVLK